MISRIPSRVVSSFLFLQCKTSPLGQSDRLRLFCSLRNTLEHEGGPVDGKQQSCVGSLDFVRDKLLDPNTLPKAAVKPATCTADELHYVSVPGTTWKLALWRYLPGPERASPRNHPLLMLSGVGTNAIGFDLHPNVSMARHMAEQGFDTWILEVRGSGLSKRERQLPSGQTLSKATVTDHGIDTQLAEEPEKMYHGGTKFLDETDSASNNDENVDSTLSNIFFQVYEKLNKVMNDGQSRLLSTALVDRISKLLESFQLSDRYAQFRENIQQALNERQNSAIVKQIEALSSQLLKLFEDGQRAVSPQLLDLQGRLMNGRQLSELQERLVVILDDYQKLLDLLVTYDWDFDNLLEEDVPAAMEYIRSVSKPKDGNIHTIGHSMGGILLYSMISSKHYGLASVVTLASSLDYSMSNSSLKKLLPLVDPAQALNVPAVPLGALMSAIHPLAANPPYFMAWLMPQVSVQDMMEPELFKKLVLNNFCTIPAKLLIQLTSVFHMGGLRNRTGTALYKDHLHMCTTPILTVAADEDLICPPEAVIDTIKHLPVSLVTYKLFGGKSSHHYGHYDLVCAHMAKQEVFPCIQEFLIQNDDCTKD